MKNAKTPRYALGAALIGALSLLPATAAAAGPVPSAVTSPSAPSVAQAVQADTFAWLYKGFYRNRATCEARRDWYWAHGIQAYCRPLFAGNTTWTFGYNLYVRSRLVGA